MTAKVVVFVCIAALAQLILGQTFEVVHSFDGLATGLPAARLAQARDGYLYGTTLGGAQDEESGAVFKMTHGGILSVLTYFREPSSSERYNPSVRLIQGSDGNFYGTTFGEDDLGATRKGSVFRMTPAGAVTTIARFNGTNGAHPAAELVEGRDGSFYGTTVRGATNNYGTVFRVTKDGQLTSLISFDGWHGRNPVASLILARDGFFYGTTGDMAPRSSGFIFRMAPDGSWTNIVRTLWRAWGPVIEGPDGNFYGTTINLSDFDVPRGGNIFRLTPQGNWNVLKAFEQSIDGSGPLDGLTQGSDGDFYGVTYQGGENGLGTVFKISPGGSFTTVVSFNGTNGARPLAGLTLGSDGNLYGTTSQAGKHNAGTVYRILMPNSLRLRRDQDRLILFWSTNAAHFRLQTTTDLTAPIVWSDFSDINPVAMDQFAVTNVLSESTRFFRLAR